MRYIEGYIVYKILKTRKKVEQSVIFVIGSNMKAKVECENYMKCKGMNLIR